MGLSSVRGRQKQGKSRAPSAQPCATCRAPGRAGSGAPAPWRVVRTADELPEHRALHRGIWSHLAGDVSGAHATAPSPGERPGRDVCSSVGCQQSTGAKPPLPFTPPLALPFSLSEQGGDCGWSEGEAAGEIRGCRGGGRIEGPAPALAAHPNRKRPAALPSAWGDFLWGPGKGFCLFDVCRKSSFRNPLFCQCSSKCLQTS